MHVGLSDGSYKAYNYVQFTQRLVYFSSKHFVIDCKGRLFHFYSKKKAICIFLLFFSILLKKRL